jgi:hypothetical protein
MPDKQLDNELLVMEIIRVLFVDGVVPTNAEVIERVKELQTFLEQMHARRGE